MITPLFATTWVFVLTILIPIAVLAFVVIYGGRYTYKWLAFQNKKPEIEEKMNDKFYRRNLAIRRHMGGFIPGADTEHRRFRKHPVRVFAEGIAIALVTAVIVLILYYTIPVSILVIYVVLLFILGSCLTSEF